MISQNVHVGSFIQVRTYSDWVIDGDYDWPPKCSACQAVLQDEDTATTRLGCLRKSAHTCVFPSLHERQSQFILGVGAESLMTQL